MVYIYIFVYLHKGADLCSTLLLIYSFTGKTHTLFNISDTIQIYFWSYKHHRLLIGKKKGSRFGRPTWLVWFG